MLLASCPVLAYTDIELLKTPKTLSCFFLLPTDSSVISSGLVYNQKQNDKLALEVSGTFYENIYPFTKNAARIRVNEKYKISEFGPVTLTVMAGPAIYYAPGTGLGLAADAGGIFSVKISGNLAASLAINGTIFKDGIGLDAEPMINFAPPFLINTEIYGGARLETSMAGFSLTGVSSGMIKYYANAGLRIGF